MIGELTRDAHEEHRAGQGILLEEDLSYTAEHPEYRPGDLAYDLGDAETCLLIDLCHGRQTPDEPHASRLDRLMASRTPHGRSHETAQSQYIQTIKSGYDPVPVGGSRRSLIGSDRSANEPILIDDSTSGTNADCSEENSCAAMVCQVSAISIRR